MKKIRIILSVICALALAAALAACADEPAQGTASEAASASEASASDFKDTLEKATSLVESVIDVSGKEVHTDDSNQNSLYRYWDVDNPGSTEVGSTFLVDGKEITALSSTVKDLKDFGFKLNDLPETIEPGVISSVNLTKDGKTFFCSLKENDTDKAIPIDEMIISGFTVGTAEFAIPFEYQGITSNSSLKDVVDALGEPNQAISISSDAVITTIELGYMQNAAEGDKTISKVFNVQFKYDAGADDFVYYGASLSLNEVN